MEWSPVYLVGVVLVAIVAEVSRDALAAEPQLLLPVRQRVHGRLDRRPDGLDRGLVGGEGGRRLDDGLELLDWQVRDDLGVTESLKGYIRWNDWGAQGRCTICRFRAKIDTFW